MIFFLYLFLCNQFYLEMWCDYNYFYNNDTLYLCVEYKIPYDNLIFIRDKDNAYLSRLLVQLVLDNMILEKVDTIFLENYEGIIDNKVKEGKVNLKLLTSKLKEELKIFIKDLHSEKEYRKRITLNLREPTIFISTNHKEYARLSINDSLVFRFLSYRTEEKIFYQIVGPDERIIKKDTVRDNLLKVFLSEPSIFSQSGNYRVEFSNKEIKRSFSFYLNLPFYLSDKEYFKKISYLIYVATPKEMEELRKAKREERELKWREFWRKKDISEEEYFSKVAYCEENFGRGDRGVFSDRAKIYFQYGEPDYVENFPYEIDKKPYIKWYYYRYNKEFVFVDLRGFGEYILVSEK